MNEYIGTDKISVVAQ